MTAKSRPLDVLQRSLNGRVIVEMRAGREYRGILDGFDPHLNVVLREAEEFVDGNVARKFPLAIVRGDNVVFISP